jgi:hypothetical protein
MDGWWEWGVVKISGSERAVDWSVGEVNGLYGTLH